MAPQAAPHRRGGTHRVKDEHRTNTIYDDWSYKQLKSGAEGRGVYIKDSKKWEMAKAIADYEQKKKRAERDTIIQRELKRQELEREKQEENDRRLQADAAKHRRRMEKQAKRDRAESVSDDTPNEDELRLMHEMYGNDDDHGDQGAAGQALSQESWDSTSTESSLCSPNLVVVPEHKLRLFEWPYAEMPSPVARSSYNLWINSAQGHQYRTAMLSVKGISAYGTSTRLSPSPPTSPTAMGERPEPIPRNVPYAPLKVHTTASREKLFLPGQTYPPGVDPDYVPILSPRTRYAVRNGVLQGVLCKAIVERATSWTIRTQIQGWNARMFFSLPPRNKDKKLVDVYNKWVLENRKLTQIKSGANASKENRQQRHIQRHKNKPKKLVDVLEASEYRPTAICYLPAYLDYHTSASDMHGELDYTPRTIDNLFYIRFPSCDVPHYYFWTRTGEWPDPTTPNPNWAWNPNASQHNTPHPTVSGKRLPAPIRTRSIRTKIPKSAPPTSSQSMPQSLPGVIAYVEYLLYHSGLAATLATYRAKWLAAGKHRAWELFGRKLPLSYPSGVLPVAPPVESCVGRMSLAEKIAKISCAVSEDGDVEVYTGNEAWTGRDDSWWEVIEVRDDDVETGKEQRGGESNNETEESGSTDLKQEPEDLDFVDLKALYRRASIPTLSAEKCVGWLDQVDAAYSPLSVVRLPSSPEVDGKSREEWEERFLQNGASGTDLRCPFCLGELGGMGVEEQAKHMYSHSTVGRMTSPQSMRKSRCRISGSDNNFLDSGADGDNEKTPTKPHRQTHCNTKTASLGKQTLGNQYKPFQVQQSTSSVSQAQSHRQKRPRDNLDFLTAYDDMQPSVLDRRSSKTANPSSAKRRKISDPTYRARLLSSSEEENLHLPRAGSSNRKVPSERDAVRKMAAKKRKRSVDPTYCVYLGSKSDEEVLEPVRKKNRKRTGIVCGDGSVFSVGDAGNEVEVGSERVETMDGEVPVWLVPEVENGVEVYGDAEGVENEDVRRNYEDDEESVWKRNWCRVL